MAEMLSKDPLASECCARGDGDSGDAHDDVWSYAAMFRGLEIYLGFK